MLLHLGLLLHLGPVITLVPSTPPPPPPRVWALSFVLLSSVQTRSHSVALSSWIIHLAMWSKSRYIHYTARCLFTTAPRKYVIFNITSVGQRLSSWPWGDVEMKFHLPASSIFLVHYLGCGKSVELTYLYVLRGSIKCFGQVLTSNERADELWKLPWIRHFVQWPPTQHRGDRTAEKRISEVSFTTVSN